MKKLRNHNPEPKPKIDGLKHFIASMAEFMVNGIVNGILASHSGWCGLSKVTSIDDDQPVYFLRGAVLSIAKLKDQDGTAIILSDNMVIRAKEPIEEIIKAYGFAEKKPAEQKPDQNTPS